MALKQSLVFLVAGITAFVASGVSAQTQPVHSHAAPAVTAGVNPDRIIEIRPGQQYVNVTNGETVMFKVAGKSFVTKFYSMVSHGSFPLAEIAPSGVDVRGITVYCSPDLYERAG